MAQKLSELYAVSEVSFTRHNDEILRLWQLFDADDPPDEEKVDWLYVNNPEGKGKAVGLWHTPTSNLAGIMGFSSRSLYFGKSSFHGCLIADLIIEPKHRALGPFRLISEKAAKLALEEFEVMYGFPIVTAPTPNLGEIVERDIDYVDAVLPLNLGHFLERRIPSTLAKLCGKLIQPISLLRLKWTSRRLRRCFSEANVSNAFIDALWGRVRGADRLQGKRNASAVRWRLTLPPFTNSELFGIKDAEERPAALAIYKVEENGVAKVIDLCWVDLESAEAALNELVKTLMAAGVRSLSIKLVSCYDDFAAMLKRLGFRARRSRTLRLVVRPEFASVANADEIWIQPLDNDYV